MSYILSALKKAEYDRNLGRVPNLSEPEASEHTPQEPQISYKTFVFIIGIVILVAVNGMLFIGMSADSPPRQNSPTVTSPQGDPQPSSVMPTESRVKPRPTPTFFEVPNESRVTPSLDEPLAAPKSVESAAGLPAEGISNYSDLSEEVRAKLPRLAISGHVFVPNKPKISRIIIDGKAFRTGQIVADNVRIKEIKAETIIFELDGRYFQIETDQLF